MAVADFLAFLAALELRVEEKTQIMSILIEIFPSNSMKDKMSILALWKADVNLKQCEKIFLIIFCDSAFHFCLVLVP